MKLYLNEGESVTVVRNHIIGSHAVTIANCGGELLGVREFCDGQPLESEEAETPSTNISRVENGEYVKFEEAMEASSNSLQQLKAEIAACAIELDRAEDIHPRYSTVDRVIERLRQLSAV